MEASIAMSCDFKNVEFGRKAKSRKKRAAEAPPTNVRGQACASAAFQASP